MCNNFQPSLAAKNARTMTDDSFTVLMNFCFGRVRCTFSHGKPNTIMFIINHVLHFYTQYSVYDCWLQRQIHWRCYGSTTMQHDSSTIVGCTDASAVTIPATVHCVLKLRTELEKAKWTLCTPKNFTGCDRELSIYHMVYILSSQQS